MGTVQLLLLLVAFIVFGSFNLLMTRANLARVEAECNLMITKDMYDIGRNAQVYYDSTHTFTGFEIKPYYQSNPYSSFTKIVETDKITLTSINKIDNKNIVAEITPSTYTLQ